MSDPYPARQRVLVVDDDAGERLLTGAALSQGGFDVVEAETGAQALELFAACAPDVVLMDVVMPVMDGFTACARLRAEGSGRHVPIVMITGLDDLESIEKAYQAGATDFVTKPINWLILQHRIRYILRGAEAQDALRRSERSLADAQRIAGLGNWSWEVAADTLSCSEEVYRILGLGPTGVPTTTVATLIDAVHPGDRERLQTSLRRCVEVGEAMRLEHRLVRPDGEIRMVQTQAEVTRTGVETRARLVGTVQDITDRTRTEAELRKLSHAVEQSPISIAITDAGGRIVYVNPRYQQFSGRGRDEMLGTVPSPLCRDRDDAEEEAGSVWDAIDRRTAWHGELCEPGSNGEPRWEAVHVSGIRGPDGILTHLLVLREDITEKKRSEERIQFLAYYDNLTGLPNRIRFQERLTQELDAARRRAHPLAVLSLDLDHFKRVNDGLGQRQGDALLQAVSRRLRRSLGDTSEAVHPAQPHAPLAARLAGDEFAVLLPRVTGADATMEVARRILADMEEAFEVEGYEVYAGASIGIALYPDDGQDADTLIKHADAALHHAKEHGRNTCRLYSASMHAATVERLTLENRLRRALERDELIVHFQPQLSLASGRIVGAEALVRWQSPELGMISPATFIPLAEETGLIIPIGEWVLRRACEEARAWQLAGLPAVRMAVNLSASQFMRPGLTELVARVLKESGLEAGHLEVEITESLLMRDVDGAIATLNALKDMGVQAAIDDFGTGYSSLSYLKRFPIDRLKIDRSFVRDVTSDPDDAAIALAIIAMAHSLKLAVIAEGVETAEQLAFLRQRRCDEMQGFYFSRPVPANEMAALLAQPPALGAGEPESDGEAPRILLLVDDEAHVTASLRRILHRDGYRILTASSAREGFELLATQSVGVVVSDQRMPEMNGTEFLSRVRELYPETVRIALSGHSDMDALVGAINEGAIYKFLAKPVPEGTLRSTLREAFLVYEGRRMQPRLATAAS